MTRDYSKFFSEALPSGRPTHGATPLEAFGWQAFFAQQTGADELALNPPVRVVEVHRNGLHVAGDGVDESIPQLADATVGDWLLLDRDRPQASRVLDRKSLIKRRAPGTDRQVQLIAANVDSSLIVSSCNQDFNIARLERYISLAFEAVITPVIVLTKADLAADPEDFVERARAISDVVPVIALDARGDEPIEKLTDWCKPGQTIAGRREPGPYTGRRRHRRKRRKTGRRWRSCQPGQLPQIIPIRDRSGGKLCRPLRFAAWPHARHQVNRR